MVATAVSALFISGGGGPRLGSFGLIHLLIPVTLGMLVMALFIWPAATSWATAR